MRERCGDDKVGEVLPRKGAPIMEGVESLAKHKLCPMVPIIQTQFLESRSSWVMNEQRLSGQIQQKLRILTGDVMVGWFQYP
jgi:hypothetical protein